MVIESQPDLKVVFEESSAQAALERLPEATLDVLLLEPRLKDFDGITFLRRYVSAKQEAGGLSHRILMTGPFLAQDFVAECLANGAHDVVSLDLGAEVLLAAIRDSADGTEEFDFSELDELLQSVEPDDTTRQVLLNLHELSADEIRVLGAFEKRMTETEISRATGFSMLKVNRAFKRILEVFGFSTKKQLAVHLVATGRMDD